MNKQPNELILDSIKYSNLCAWYDIRKEVWKLTLVSILS